MAASAMRPDVAPVLPWVMNTALPDILKGHPETVAVRRS